MARRTRFTNRRYREHFDPYIAQSVAWQLLIHHEKGEQIFFDFSNSDQPPMFAPMYDPKTGEKIGFATVYYDNYLIATLDVDVARTMSLRIRRNASLFNIVIKEHFEHFSNSLLSKPCTYLGMEIGLVTKRDHLGLRDKRYLRWRLAKESDHVPFFNCKSTLTPKVICQTIGRCIYARLISLRPLGAVNTTVEVLMLLRRLFTHAWKTSWDDTTFVLMENEIAACRSEWIYVEQRLWHSWTPLTPNDLNTRVATDASDFSWGAVILDTFGNVVHNSGPRNFPDDIKDGHIFLKEMYAAVQGSRLAMQLFPTSKMISLMVDNTATAAAVRRGYCGETGQSDAK